MGRSNKITGQRRWEQQMGKIQPPETQPADVRDPLQVLADLKKDQLIEYYSERYGLSTFLLSNVWDYLKTATPQKIKAIKRGNVKNLIKRRHYREGDILQNGEVIGNSLDDTLKKDDTLKDVCKI
ncbi:hypothetical protein CMI37_29745 [Candidatus Pacearchaeota archaeon]|nr:hypothetical protein [Candidatus Pacearchaeota archaeon]|tara:strand:+ start:430 stop:804 length:375 start_codon:yes stop_codon:yes gene_type:complete